MSSVLAPSPAAKYGAAFMPGAATNPGQDSQLPLVAGPSPDDQTSFWHPDHPLFWLGLVLAGAVGFAYFSTTVRVGPVEGSASLGKK